MKSLFDRFEERYVSEPNSGCWLWLGKITTPHRYGVLSLTTNGKIRELKAHQVAYQIYVGAIPGGLELDHKCRVRCCVNPDHLEPVTRRENIRRGASRVADNMRKTHCPQGHVYSHENTYLDPKGGRKCRECHRINERERSRRRRA